MASGTIDLGSIFKQVSKTLQQNQNSLNEADTYNHDHGDHMVEIFDVITQAMKEKKSADPADQLEYAASLLRKKSNSGSSTIYADGLTKAAKQVTGKDIDISTVLSILTTILGASGSKINKSSAGSGGLLDSLLGQMAGSSSAESQSGDLLGSLLGQLAGGSTASAQDDDGIDLGDLLSAGMSYMNAKQSGKSGLDALTGALVNNSQVASSSTHRAQSTELVTSTVLDALTSMLN
jgi:hypothetical protein